VVALILLRDYILSTSACKIFRVGLEGM
jgi:hypothetical protein